MDALAYESFYDVLSIYSDVVLSRKGLRKEEFIEIPEIIRNPLFFFEPVKPKQRLIFTSASVLFF